MSNLKDIKNYIIKEFPFDYLGVEPTEIFIHNTAHDIKALLDEGECKSIEEAVCFIVTLSDHEFWEGISEQQKNGTERNFEDYEVDIFMEVDQLFNNGLI